MVDQLTVGKNVAEGIAAFGSPDAPVDLPATPLRHRTLPIGLRTFYERTRVVLASRRSPGASIPRGSWPSTLPGKRSNASARSRPQHSTLMRAC